MISNKQRFIQAIFSFLLGLGIASSAVHADIPSFVHGSIYSSNSAEVSSINQNLSADVVILNGGLEQGLRRGMVCTAERNIKTIGELIIIESNSNCAAALILDLETNTTIQPGDTVRIKTI